MPSPLAMEIAQAISGYYVECTKPSEVEAIAALIDAKLAGVVETLESARNDLEEPHAWKSLTAVDETLATLKGTP